MSTTVALPQSFTFQSLVQQQLTWNLVDQSGNIISGATVTATLYANRSRSNPITVPGIADSVFNNITLIETPGGSGTYIGTIPETFNPSPAITWFVVVISATQGPNTLADFEIPAIVVPPQNAIDIVLLEDVKSFLNIPSTNTDDDKTLQIIITGFSKYVLNLTGITSFNQVGTFTEYYDGNGNTRLFLRNTPIQTLNSVTIGSYQVPFSSNTATSGIYIEDSRRSIAFRWSGTTLFPPYAIYPYYFTPGQGNIQVVYTAGYSSVPFDLYEAVMETVATYYRRKDWLDMASKALAAGGGASGTTTYRSWHVTPAVQAVLSYYSRYART